MKRGFWLIGMCGVACSFEGVSGLADSEVASSGATTGTTGVTSGTAGPTTLGTGTSQGVTGPSTSTSAPDSASSTEGETTSPGETTSTVDTTGGPAETTADTSSGGPTFELCDAGDPDLRACHDFANAGSGVLVDLSMYGNDGTVSDAAVEAGPFGEAVRPSADARIAIPDSASLDLPGPLTWETWVYFDALPKSGRVGLLDNDSQYSTIYYPGMGVRCDALGSAFAPAVPVGQWVHIACVLDDGTLTAWVDGELGATTVTNNAAATSNGDPVSIGDTSPGFDEPMDGLVGGVRIWSSARTEAEIIEAASAVR